MTNDEMTELNQLLQALYAEEQAVGELDWYSLSWRTSDQIKEAVAETMKLPCIDVHVYLSDIVANDPWYLTRDPTKSFVLV